MSNLFELWRQDICISHIAKSAQFVTIEFAHPQDFSRFMERFNGLDDRLPLAKGLLQRWQYEVKILNGGLPLGLGLSLRSVVLVRMPLEDWPAVQEIFGLQEDSSPQ